MDTKNKNRDKEELDIITAYAQMVFFTLQNSETEITPKAIKAEVKMFYEKFGNKVEFYIHSISYFM